MFYYPTVLKRHSGCFSTVWLAATKGMKVSRRDYLSVNVKRTCDDILDYVLVQVPPPQPGLPRPRFSLYLSSQLQYGVVLVYRHQCVILLEELQDILRSMSRHGAAETGDTETGDRLKPGAPDPALSLLQEAEWNQDPFFGVMPAASASPRSPAQVGRGEEASPGSSQRSSPAAPLEDNITASPDSITLRETAPVAVPEFDGVELPEHHAGMMDLLLAQADHFPEEADVAPAARERERREQDPEGERAKEITGSTIDLQPTVLSSDEATLLPQEEAPPLEGAAPGDITPVQDPAPPLPAPVAEETRSQIPSPTLEEMPAEGRTRKRGRRQLPLFDPATQLSQEALQRQIGDPLTETQPLALPPPPALSMLPAAELLSGPCTPLPEELLLLWRQAATITALPSSDLRTGGATGTDSSESETERAAGEPESPEVRRKMSESPIHIGDASAVHSLEVSDDREPLRETPPLDTPDTKGSLVSSSGPTGHRLEDIPEEAEFPLREEMDGIPDRPEVLDLLRDMSEDEAPVYFHTLLPPHVDRRAVSHSFWWLLENAANGKLSVEQEEPYADIRILPGPNYEKPPPEIPHV